MDRYVDDRGVGHSSGHRPEAHVGSGGLTCPVCGGEMKEALSLKERGSRFVWLECSRTDCQGLLLKRHLS